MNAYAETAPLLAQAGARVLVPWLRGYGPTRFRSASTMRSGEQAALGADLLAFMNALKTERAVVGGYDWGGRAACVVSVLHPERVIALVSGNSYNIQNIARSMEPASPPEEAALWYQYLFHNERGRRALERDRRGFARQLWSMWSPTWVFDDATFEKSAASFDNPDFVDVVIHFLSPPLRAGRRRSGLCGDRGKTRRAAADPCSHDCDRRRQRRRQSRHRASRAQVREFLRAPRVRRRRSQSAAGAALRMGAGRARRPESGLVEPHFQRCSDFSLIREPFPIAAVQALGPLLSAARCRGGFE